MSREIKFKVWDTENEEYSNWTNRDPHFDVSNSRLFFWERTQKEDGSYGGDIVLEDYGNRFILLQYTGLVDKNGKEIYEGDIVTYFPFKQRNAEVIWSDGAYYLSCNEEIWPLNNYTINEDHVAVIGNIFENPELIKQ